jgi:hypothetical protein
VTLISSNLYDQLPSQRHLSLNNYIPGLTTADGGSMKERGKVRLLLQFMNRLFTFHAMVVVDGLHTPGIVGAYFTEKHGICIDVKQRKLTFSETAKNWRRADWMKGPI